MYDWFWCAIDLHVSHRETEMCNLKVNYVEDSNVFYCSLAEKKFIPANTSMFKSVIIENVKNVILEWDTHTKLTLDFSFGNHMVKRSSSWLFFFTAMVYDKNQMQSLNSWTLYLYFL